MMISKLCVSKRVTDRLVFSSKMSDKWNSLAADNVHLTIGMCQFCIINIKGNMRNNTEIQLVIQHIV